LRGVMYGLVHVKEAVRRLKEAGVGRDATYALARKHGVKLGRRLYLPRPLLEGLLEGNPDAIRLIREGGA